jgi:hypothetical protein
MGSAGAFADGWAAPDRGAAFDLKIPGSFGRAGLECGCSTEEREGIGQIRSILRAGFSAVNAGGCLSGWLLCLSIWLFGLARIVAVCCAFRLVIQHGAEFVYKVAYVFELAIDRCETDERNLVDISEQAEDLFSDVSGWDLFFVVVVDVTFDGVDEAVELFLADGAFPARFFQAGSNSVFVEGDS